MRNLLLAQACEHYCREAIDLLGKKYPRREDLPSKVVEKPQVTGPGSISFPSVAEVQWYLLVYENEEVLKALETHMRVRDVFMNDDVVARHMDQMVGTVEAKGRVDFERCIDSLLIQILNKLDGFRFNDRDFADVYKSVEDFFYEEHFEYRFTAPLPGFRMEGERLDLGDNLYLVRIAVAEQEELLMQQREMGGMFQPRFMFSPDYMLETRVRVPKVIGDGGAEAGGAQGSPFNTVRGKFDDVCTALRLFKGGHVAKSFVQSRCLSWHPLGGRATLFSPPGVSEVVHGNTYDLNTEEVERFARFWHEYKNRNTGNLKRAQVALRRLDFAYERIRREDKLVDYLIGFEALLLRESERQELSYRLALRGAALLGETSDRRKEIFGLLSAAYSERSRIVHGGEVRRHVKVDGGNVPFPDFVARTEELLRLAIREFISRGSNMAENQIIRNLDEKIARGE